MFFCKPKPQAVAGMNLKTFIRESISDIIGGIHEADETITKANAGYIWKKNLITGQENLVELGLAKGDTGEDKKSKPVLVLRFDLSIAVETESKSSDAASLDLKGKITVVGFDGGVKGTSEQSRVEKSIHNLKFSVPVGLGKET